MAGACSACASPFRACEQHPRWIPGKVLQGTHTLQARHSQQQSSAARLDHRSVCARLRAENGASFDQRKRTESVTPTNRPSACGAAKAGLATATSGCDSSTTVLAALLRCGSWARSNRCGAGLRCWHCRVLKLRLLTAGTGFVTQICSCPGRHSPSIIALAMCTWAPVRAEQVSGAACKIRSRGCTDHAPVGPASPLAALGMWVQP